MQTSVVYFIFLKYWQSDSFIDFFKSSRYIFEIYIYIVFFYRNSNLDLDYFLGNLL